MHRIEKIIPKIAFSFEVMFVSTQNLNQAVLPASGGLKSTRFGEITNF